MRYEQQFSLDPSIIYLNHAAIAPWPKATRQAVEDFAKENQQFGATGYLTWLDKEAELKQQLAELIHAPSSDDIALLKNTSEALSVIAQGITWQAGDNLVLIREEFPSNRLVWQHLESQGVSIRWVSLDTVDDPEQAIMEATDARTRLISVSFVQYHQGWRMNVEHLGAYCHAQHILFCIDAIQGLGAIPFDCQACHADFVVADGHKWLLAPEGLALFYVKAEVRAQLTLHQFGWRMMQNPIDFDAPPHDLSVTATRFECGSPNMLSIHALSASLTVILGIGVERIYQQLIHNIDYLCDLIEQHDELTLLSCRHKNRQSGIVTFQVSGVNSESLYQQLMQHRVICACRGGGVRFSPHFYTSEAQLKAAIEQTLSLAKGMRID